MSQSTAMPTLTKTLSVAAYAEQLAFLARCMSTGNIDKLQKSVEGPEDFERLIWFVDGAFAKRVENFRIDCWVPAPPHQFHLCSSRYKYEPFIQPVFDIVTNSQPQNTSGITISGYCSMEESIDSRGFSFGLSHRQPTKNAP